MYIRASIAMAVYNGEKFLREQIDSILALMSEQDELIISYDKSIDNTWNIIEEISQTDSRIKIVTNKNKPSVIGNFNNSVGYCSGEYIFLADQDDIWINDKINKMIEVLQSKENVVSSDAIILDNCISWINLNRNIIEEKISNENYIDFGKK